MRWQRSCNGRQNQQWTVHADGTITDNQSGLCLDGHRRGDGQRHAA